MKIKNFKEFKKDSNVKGLRIILNIFNRKLNDYFI